MQLWDKMVVKGLLKYCKRYHNEWVGSIGYPQDGELKDRSLPFYGATVKEVVYVDR